MQEGTLVHSTNRGRFALDDAQYGPDLKSGDVVSIWLGGRWVAGRIEHAHRFGGYYFVASNGGICALCIDMKIRLH